MNYFSHVLNTLFNYFEEKEVSYCILHGYETLPEYALTDVDMAIDPQQRNKLDRLLNKAAQECGFTIIQKINQDIPCCCYYALVKMASPTMDIIKLDFLIDEYGLNKYYLPSETLLVGKVRYKNFYVPSCGVQAVYLLIKKAMKDKFLEVHMKKLRDLYVSDNQEMSLFLEKYFGKSIGSEVLDAIKMGNKERINLLIPQLREEIKNSRGKNFIKRTIWSVRRILLRTIHPTGELIVILSPDGGGKSSVARATLKKLFVGFFWRVEYLHWRPGLLPQLRKLLGKSTLNSEFVIANPHCPKRRSRIISFLRWLYYSIDYIIGYYLKILPMKIRTTAVIMDRYYYDILVDPIRYGFNIPHWIIKSILFLIPKPDLTIYLDNEPAELFKRKQELPLEEIERQIKAWRDVMPSLPNARIVTTDKPLEAVIQEVTIHVLERRAEMTKKILQVDPDAAQYLWESDHTDYIALPSKRNCRWIMPTNPKLAKKAWDLYQPYSLRGRFYKHFNKSFVNMNPFLYRKIISQDTLNSDKSEILTNKLVEILGMDDIVMPISTGTPSPFRKITGIVMSSDGKPQACIKIGETPLAIERIKNEAKILKELAISNQLSAISIPKCVYEGEIGNGYLLIQSPAPFDGKSGGKYFNEDYENILETLINNTSVTKKLNESEFYKQLKEGINNYSLSYKDVLQNGFKYLKESIGDKEIIFSLSHGDFAPWNMVWSKNKKEVFIYDWESANPEAPSGIDIVHFLFQTGFLLKKLRGDKLLMYILQSLTNQGLSKSIPLPLHDVLVMLYSLHMAVTEDEPQQLSSAAVERRNLIKALAHN